MGLSSFFDHDIGEQGVPIPLCRQSTCDRDTVLGTEHILFVVSQQAMGPWGARSNRLEVTMTTSLPEVHLKRGNILGKIKVINGLILGSSG